MVQRLSDQDPTPKDLSSPVDHVPDFSQSINEIFFEICWLSNKTFYTFLSNKSKVRQHIFTNIETYELTFSE